MTEIYQPQPPEEDNVSTVTEIEVMPGVYEVYDNVSGELVDIGGGEEEV